MVDKRKIIVVTELVQITDTERWHQALAASAGAVEEATGTPAPSVRTLRRA
jgi:hypothetical protein